MKARIFVAGHRGLVGSALLRELARRQRGDELVLRTRSELDLLRRDDVFAFFDEERPTHVLLATTLGTIAGDAHRPVDLLVETLLSQTHVIEAAARFGVTRLLYFGGSRLDPPPGLAASQEGAQQAALALVDACVQQYRLSAVSLLSTTLYGPGDNFGIETAQLVPALMRRMHEAKETHSPFVTIGGSGSPRRELLHVDDLARAAIDLLDDATARGQFNVGGEVELSIAELADLLRSVIGFDGALVFDSTRPEGGPAKRIDWSRLRARNWRPLIPILEGLTSTYAWYGAARRRAAGRLDEAIEEAIDPAIDQALEPELRH